MSHLAAASLCYRFSLMSAAAATPLVLPDTPVGIPANTPANATAASVLPDAARAAGAAVTAQVRTNSQLFKVLAVGAGEPWEPLGFSHGDRSHRL